MAECTSGGHPVLPVRVLEKLVHGLLVFPETADEFEAFGVGEVGAGGGLVAECGCGCGAAEALFGEGDKALEGFVVGGGGVG